MSEVPVQMINKERSKEIVDYLTKHSNLKDGSVIVSFFELEQFLNYLPAATEGQRQTKDVMYMAFANVVGKVYKAVAPTDFGSAFIADIELCRFLVFEKVTQ